jgi:dihydrofolate reductase
MKRILTTKNTKTTKKNKDLMKQENALKGPEFRSLEDFGILLKILCGLRGLRGSKSFLCSLCGFAVQITNLTFKVVILQYTESNLHKGHEMRKIIATEYLTLDGVMEDPGGQKGGRGGWSFQFWNEEAAKFKYDELFSSGALLLGRVTYEGFAKAWPTMKDTGDFGERMNGLPKYVVSTSLKSAEWNNSTIIRGSLGEEMMRLKQLPGQDILLSGSASLVQALMELDLIDEYRLMVHPIVVGGGKRLFKDDGQRKALRLTGTKTFSTGIIVLSYEPENK